MDDDEDALPWDDIRIEIDQNGDAVSEDDLRRNVVLGYELENAAYRLPTMWVPRYLRFLRYTFDGLDTHATAQALSISEMENAGVANYFEVSAQIPDAENAIDAALLGLVRLVPMKFRPGVNGTAVNEFNQMLAVLREKGNHIKP